MSTNLIEMVVFKLFFLVAFLRRLALRYDLIRLLWTWPSDGGRIWRESNSYYNWSIFGGVELYQLAAHSEEEPRPAPGAITAIRAGAPLIYTRGLASCRVDAAATPAPPRRASSPWVHWTTLIVYHFICPFCHSLLQGCSVHGVSPSERAICGTPTLSLKYGFKR